MKKESYLEYLDKALLFAARHTDFDGRMMAGGEIDTKDSGWVVLGGMIRGIEFGWGLGEFDLRELCRKWLLASVRVNDNRSAWTTFALLFAEELSPSHHLDFLSGPEQKEYEAFLRQLDMKYLLEASRNYRIAAAFIEILRLRRGYVQKTDVDPDSCIEYMLDGYLGNGFFNDDDGRGDSRDRRIDAYSAEIIGLLLHYDEIFNWHSKQHERIFRILREFCESSLKLIDADGEFAKWGRSLRGEAEIKKVFLWEFAQTHGLTEYGDAAARKMRSFFLKTGIASDGKIGKDKAFDQGTRDEYTTDVQAQGYGIYGLAMAVRFASGEYSQRKLPSETQDYTIRLEGPGIFCANSHSSGIHYILPEHNRMTKNMFFWHNRITGENDVNVDVSTKFMPLPYFGHKIPAPYSGSVVPFLPMLRLPDSLSPEKEGILLLPRNLDGPGAFRFCRSKEYTPAVPGEMKIKWNLKPAEIGMTAVFSGEFPSAATLEVYFFDPADGIKAILDCPKAKFERIVCGPSIYAPETRGTVAVFTFSKKIEYSVRYEHV